MGRVLTIGETMGVAVTDPGDPLRTTRSLRLSTAGAESTVAIGMRRLGHDAVWVGVVGGDELGARVLRDLAAEGVDTRFARIDPDGPTGFMLRELRTAEYTGVSYYRTGSAGSHLTADDVAVAFSAFEVGAGADSGIGIDVVHLTGITPALSETCAEAIRCAVRLARAASIPVSFDVNYRSTLSGSGTVADFVKELLPEITILFVGDDELALVTDEPDPECAARDLLTCGPSEVVVKRGANGALAATAISAASVTASVTGSAVPAVSVVSHPALPVRVVDAIGAGDSFTAGYLAARCEGLPLAERLRWGSIAAACTVGTHGDWEGLPTCADLHRRAAAVTAAASAAATSTTATSTTVR
jgi:2-dehydro-3-deoxygluconokinase